MEISVSKLKANAAKVNLLYVEDDELIQAQTKDFLGRFFPNITLASNGEEGLNTYKSASFDLIITDINMPRMNGIEMIEAIKEQNAEQEVIVTSAYNDSENLQKLINLGVNNFVLKPFNNKMFLQVLYRVIDHIVLYKESAERAYLTQAIVDMIPSGIVVLKAGEISMVNQAFLDLSGFENMQTLLLESPEIGVIFHDSEHCITATDNTSFIKELKTRPKSEHRVRLLKESGFEEFSIEFTAIDEDALLYALLFTNITAINRSLSLDEHTNLPGKKQVLEQISLLRHNVSTAVVFCLRVKHFENVLQWYGKKDAIEIEKEAAQRIKEVNQNYLSGGFIGYFSQNMFVCINEKITYGALGLPEIKKEVANISLAYNSSLDNRHINAKVDFHLTLQMKAFTLELSQSLEEIEVQLINAFDSLSYER